MENLKDVMIEETVNEVNDEVVSEFAASANTADRRLGKVVVVLGGVAAFLGVKALYKKVIKPKLDEHKAKKAAAKALATSEPVNDNSTESND